MIVSSAFKRTPNPRQPGYPAEHPSLPAEACPGRHDRTGSWTRPTARPAKTILGEGGELHQQASGAKDRLTTNHGVTVSDNQNSLKAGPRGPTLLEDFVLREKIHHFDHERIPERIVHARGSGAHGYFELTESLEAYTTAKVLTEVGSRTEVFTRFSTVAGGAGSVDTPRDVRGFAVKLYTKEGNWDLVGNDIPVFFIQGRHQVPRPHSRPPRWSPTAATPRRRRPTTPSGTSSA